MVDFLVILIDIAFEVYFWLIFARVILSWLPIKTSSGLLANLIEFVYDVTEPFLRLIRKYIPMVSLGSMGLDLSPIIALILLDIARRVIIRLLLIV